MKFKKVIFIGLAAAAVVSALPNAFAASAMTAAQAEALAADYVPQGSEKLWSEYDDGVYEIDFYNDTLKERYEVKVSPVSKAIIEVDSELYDDRGGKTVIVTEDEAKKAVTDEQEGAKIVSAYVDYDDGRRVYKVRFEADDCYGEYKIHTETAAVIEREIKIGTPPSAASGTTGSVSDGYIGEARAKEIALSNAPDSTVVKCKLDRDDGRMVYEVETRNGRWEYEFDIDAASGTVLEMDVDYDD